MKHLKDIAALIETLLKSSKFHALVIQSPPGWAKSTTIDSILRGLQISYRSLGSYASPLAFFNALADTTEEIFVIDDCCGLFGEPVAMSILKAACWPSAGSPERIIKWSTTSDRVRTDSFIFSKKLILLTNSIAAGREAEAFLSRTLCLRIAFSKDEVSNLLKEATQSQEYFEDTVLALEVARYLGELSKNGDHTKINLRTLQMAYEIRRTNPEGWQALLAQLLPRESPMAIVEDLSESYLNVENQAREFIRITGMSRRTFFKYRKGSASDDRHATCTIDSALAKSEDLFPTPVG